MVYSLNRLIPFLLFACSVMLLRRAKEQHGLKPILHALRYSGRRLILFVLSQ